MTAFLIIAALILLNGLFVAAEFAIVGAPRAAIDARAARGNRLARLVQRVLRDPRQQDRYIATAQLGITVASLGLGMYGEARLAVWIQSLLPLEAGPSWLASHAVAGGIALVILTYLHIVLGEMVPKALALTRPERSALWLTPIMAGVQVAIYPFVAALNGIASSILRFLGIDRRLAGDELRAVLVLPARHQVDVEAGALVG